MTTERDQVRQFITENFLFGHPEELQDDDSFLEGGILDSTGVLQLISFLEEQYSIVVGDEDATPDNLDSVSKVSAFISRRLNGSGMQGRPGTCGL